MKILLTNDDGINAPGIRTLHRAISQIADVLVVAPESEQSAVGHAITIHAPLRATKVMEDGALFGYAINGTPADCVKLAVTELLDEPPDLVLSGVNHGGNLGTCVIYSGTVSAATEAAIMGLPAVAISLDTWEMGADFEPAAEFAKKFVPKIIQKGLPKDVSLNINVPAVPREEIKGAVFTRQGQSRVIESFERRVDPRNSTYYWLAGEMVFEESQPGTDTEMVNNNYISITPIHFDLTDYKTLEDLQDWKNPFDS